jgi:hypothetical protein
MAKAVFIAFLAVAAQALKMEKATGDVNKVMVSGTFHACISGPKSKFDGAQEWMTSNTTYTQEGTTCAEYWGLKSEIPHATVTGSKLDHHQVYPYCYDMGETDDNSYGTNGLSFCFLTGEEFGKYQQIMMIVEQLNNKPKEEDMSVLQVDVAKSLATTASTWFSCPSDFIQLGKIGDDVPGWGLSKPGHKASSISACAKECKSNLECEGFEYNKDKSCALNKKEDTVASAQTHTWANTITCRKMTYEELATKSGAHKMKTIEVAAIGAFLLAFLAH